jgi:hypothetical protein
VTFTTGQKKNPSSVPAGFAISIRIHDHFANIIFFKKFTLPSAVIL